MMNQQCNNCGSTDVMTCRNAYNQGSSVSSGIATERLGTDSYRTGGTSISHFALENAPPSVPGGWHYVIVPIFSLIVLFLLMGTIVMLPFYLLELIGIPMRSKTLSNIIGITASVLSILTTGAGTYLIYQKSKKQYDENTQCGFACGHVCDAETIGLFKTKREPSF